MLLVVAVCSCAVLVGGISAWVALSAGTRAATPITKPTPEEETACVTDPENPNGAEGCEQDPMVVCMADRYYEAQARDAESKSAFSAEADEYCRDAINNVGE